jgi:cell division protein ZapB
VLQAHGLSFCFPLNCAELNTGTSTNASDYRFDVRAAPTIWHFYRSAGCAMSKLEDLADRVERLLLRHDELQRTNALLLAQVQGLTQERDQMKSRLSAARSRIEALLDRLPTEADDAAVQADGATR